MNRRRWLRSLLAGASGLIAGCTGAVPGLRFGAAQQTTAKTSPTPRPTVTSVAGTDLPLSEDALTRGAPKDLIPAIVDPAFGRDWADLEITYINRYGNEKTITPRLTAEDRVIGVRRRDRTRAYPLRILNWHEVVNDRFDGPLLVTYCPLCGSGVTADRIVREQPTIFGVSGLLWNSDLVMYDRLTESLWSQIAGVAVRGPRTGHRLQFVPSTIATWGAWRSANPETEVLLPPPESSTVQGREAIRDYTHNPYTRYAESAQVGIGANELPDSDIDLHPKAQVLGIATEGAAKAYPLKRVLEASVVNDRVGELPVVVAVTADERTLVGYVRRVDGTTLRFERVSPTRLEADGSRWEVATGRAIDGPYAGTRLRSAARRGQMFWFAWLDFQPDTTVYGESVGP